MRKKEKEGELKKKRWQSRAHCPALSSHRSNHTRFIPVQNPELDPEHSEGPDVPRRSKSTQTHRVHVAVAHS